MKTLAIEKRWSVRVYYYSKSGQHLEATRIFKCENGENAVEILKCQVSKRKNFEKFFGFHVELFNDKT